MNSCHDEDQWIADYLDWLDESAMDPTVPRDTKGRVQLFLKGCDKSASSDVIRMLSEFADGDQPVADLTATAALDWIDAATLADDETVPRPFGEYLLLEVVGRGGMGIVYRATQLSLKRSVCIKLALPGSEDRSRLVREAELAAELQHPNIVGVLDAGTCDGRTFIAMEFVVGQSLAALLAAAPMTAKDAAFMMIGICDAVDFAHAKQILHRDLKPSNVIIDRDSRPRVADFGLAKRLHHPRVDSPDTLTGIAGSPSYMAPEQACDGELSVRTDVYGLGAILYEMLSGRPPLVGRTPLETLRLVESTEPIELGRLQVGLPKDIETICHKCLEKRPLNRYATAKELRDDLQRFLDDVPVHARPTPPWVRATRWVNRNRAISGSAAVVLFSLITTLTIGAWMLSRTSEALVKTTKAESNQRFLAQELRQAVDVSNQALYRSQIMQASQSLSVDDLPSARRALAQIDANQSLHDLARLEYDLLRSCSWPAIHMMECDQMKIVDFVWNEASLSLICLVHGRPSINPSPWFDIKATLDSRPQVAQQSKATSFPEPSILFFDADLHGQYNRSAKLCVHPNLPLVLTYSESQFDVWQIGSTQTVFAEPFPEPIQSVVWHPGETVFLAIPRTEQAILVYDTTSGRSWRLPMASGDCRSVAISSAGRVLAVMASNAIRLWRWDRITDAISATVESPTETIEFHIQPDALLSLNQWPNACLWTDDERLVVIDESGVASAFDLSDRAINDRSIEPLWQTRIDQMDPMDLQHSGRQLRLIAENQMLGLDVASGQILWEHSLPPLAKVCSSTTSSLIAVHELNSNHLQIWDSDRFATPVLVSSTAVPVRRVVLGNLGRTTAFRDVDGMITATNPSWDEPTIQFLDSVQPGTGIALCPTDDLIAISRERDVILCRLPEVNEVTRITDHASTVWSLRFDNTGRLLASGDSDGKLIVTEIATGRQLVPPIGFEGDLRAVEFSSTGRSLFVADATSQLKRIDLATGQLNQLPAIDDETINAIAVIDDHTVAAADSSGNITILNLNDPSRKTTWSAHAFPVWTLIHYDDRLLSASQDGTLRVWDHRGHLLTTLIDDDEPIWSIDHSPQAGLIVGSTTSGNVFSLHYGTAFNASTQRIADR